MYLRVLLSVVAMGWGGCQEGVQGYETSQVNEFLVK